jgi:hypothetical protein
MMLCYRIDCERQCDCVRQALVSVRELGYGRFTLEGSSFKAERPSIRDAHHPRSSGSHHGCKRDLGVRQGAEMSDSKLLRRFFRHGLLPQLFVFEAVARLGSVTRAAETLHLAQPTVSVQLRKLAEALGVQLFEPHGRCLQLTAAGHALFESCAELATCLERVDARLAPWRMPATERVLVGADPDAEGTALRLAAEFQARHPGVEIALHVAGRTELLARCAKGVDDVYVLALEVDELPAARRWSVTHATGREMSAGAALFLREALLAQAGGNADRSAVPSAGDERPRVETLDLVAGAPGAGVPRFAGRRMTQRSSRRSLR